jgi:hypothetical protein
MNWFGFHLPDSLFLHQTEDALKHHPEQLKQLMDDEAIF